MRKIIVVMIIIGLTGSAPATIINIPSDWPTIQTGINASTDGDTMLVQPGTYVENINFNGHNIVLGSLFLTTGDTSYISQTVIHGGMAGSVVKFTGGENNTAILIGFTIQNGLAQFGGGIYCYGASPLIISNTIKNNDASSEWDGFGGGIFCGGNSAPIISGNSIYINTAGGVYYGEGGGISIQSTLSPIIINNLIWYNGSHGAYGGAGGGICSFSQSIIINNTVILNYATGGGVGPQPVGGIFCGDRTARIINCIVRYNYAADLAGSADVSYTNIEDLVWPGQGNIDRDPLFRDPASRDLHLMSIACGDSADSPCIDAGDPNVLDSLLDCSWGLGGLRSDMGAYGGGDSLITAIFDNLPPLPNNIVLLQNYPNPFNAQTTIRFVLPESGDIELTVYDLLGRQVEVLVDGYMQNGIHTVPFDATHISSGVYFYRLEAGNRVETKRMLLLK